jgi:acyl carrier protein
MNDQAVRQQLRAFVARELIRDPEYAVEDSEPLISGGLVDSFALAEFAVFVEREFGVFIPNAELTVANLDTLDQMVARVLRG